MGVTLPAGYFFGGSGAAGAVLREHQDNAAFGVGTIVGRTVEGVQDLNAPKGRSLDLLQIAEIGEANAVQVDHRRVVQQERTLAPPLDLHRVARALLTVGEVGRLDFQHFPRRLALRPLDHRLRDDNAIALGAARQRPRPDAGAGDRSDHHAYETQTHVHGDLPPRTPCSTMHLHLAYRQGQGAARRAADTNHVRIA